MLKCRSNCSLHLLPFIALIALMSGNDTNTASSSGVAKPSGCTDSGILKSTACHSVPLALCFYNLGLLCDQVKSKQKYRKWILGNLHRDVQRMIAEYDMDVICFCELGPISGDMEDTLRKWMHLPGGVAKPIGMKTASPLMEQMLRDLVDGTPHHVPDC